ncbi:MAG TPA: TolC family protein, partial [Noviherbaspirillum sp.]
MKSTATNTMHDAAKDETGSAMRSTSRKHAALLPLLGALWLAGCASVDTPYQRSNTGLSEDGRFVSADVAPVQVTPSDLHWWRRFDDPQLTQWVERSLQGNPEIAVAFERVAQAQALLEQTSATREPSIAARLQAGASQRSNHNDSTGASSTSSTSSGSSADSAGTAAGINVEWDADLWGGLRQAEQSPAAGLLRTKDQAQAARLATAGTAARGYVDWRAAQNERALLEQTLGVLQDTLRLAQARVDAGLASSIDVTRAEADLAAVRAELDAAAARARQSQL